MQERLKQNNMASNLIWSYAERFFAQAITLLVSIILARILSPEHYGTIAIVTVFITIGDALVTGGFGNALVQKKNATVDDFNSIFWLSICVAIVLYGVLFLIAPVIAKFYSNEILTPVIRVMGLKFIFSAFSSIQQAYIQKRMIFKKFFLGSLGGTIISAVLGIAMALEGLGVWALVVQYLSNTIINTVILWCIIDWKPQMFVSFKSLKELWKFGSQMLAATIVYTIKDNIRSLVIGKRFTAADLAYYNQGNRFPSLLVTDIVESLGKVIFPILSKEQDSKEGIKQYMRKSIRMSSFLLNPAVIGLFAIADTFIIVLMTEKWLPCVLYLRILCLVYLTRPLTTIFQKGLLAIGKSNINLFHEIVTSILTIVLLLIAVFIFDSIPLIAISYVAIMFIGIIIFVFFIRKYLTYSVKEMMKDYIPSLSLSIIMGIICYSLGFLKIPNILKLIVQILAGIMVYVVVAKIIKIPEWIYLTKVINSKLRK